jgi:hypothetical protein
MGKLRNSVRLGTIGPSPRCPVAMRTNSSLAEGSVLSRWLRARISSRCRPDQRHDPSQPGAREQPAVLFLAQEQRRFPRTALTTSSVTSRNRVILPQGENVLIDSARPGRVKPVFRPSTRASTSLAAAERRTSRSDRPHTQKSGAKAHPADRGCWQGGRPDGHAPRPTQS